MALLFALVESNANGWSTAMQMSGKVHAIAHKRPDPNGHFIATYSLAELSPLKSHCCA
jgi:hypothetical protein